MNQKIEMLQEISRYFFAPELNPEKSPDDQKFVPQGFEQFNHCDTLCVNVPNGGFTISCRTEDGKLVTFHFGVYRKGGTPQFVDIQYHNSGTSWDNGGREVPTFDAVAFGGGDTLFHSQRYKGEGPGKRTDGKVAILTLLMQDKDREAG